MSRPKMTTAEVRVTNNLNYYLLGKYNEREVNDKPDYVNDLDSGKSIGIEIIEFQPLLKNGQPSQRISHPIVNLDEELTNTYNISKKDFFIYFHISDKDLFLKDQQNIHNLLNSQNYNDVINKQINLGGSNKFQISKHINSYCYAGCSNLQSLKDIDSNVDNVLYSWLQLNLTNKNNKLNGYIQTDFNALAIEDLHYSGLSSRSENYLRWQIAIDKFKNQQNIEYDYIFISTIDSIIKIYSKFR